MTATTGDALDPDEVAALEEQRDFLLSSLADLDREHEAGDLDDDDYEALRDDYTSRAATVLEELRTRLNSSTSAAERADMSARLQLETAQMMNDQMGLQAIELQRRAKAQADYQRSLASNKAEIDKLRTEAGVNP